MKGLYLMFAGVVLLGLAAGTVAGYVPSFSVSQTGVYMVGYSGGTINCGSSSYTGQWSFTSLNAYSDTKSVTWTDIIWFEFGNGTQLHVGQLSPTILNSKDCIGGSTVSTIGQEIAWNSGGPNPYATATTTSTTTSTSTTSVTSDSANSVSSSLKVATGYPLSFWLFLAGGIGLVIAGAWMEDEDEP